MRLVLLTALTMTAFAANSVLNRLAVGEGSIGAVDFATIRVASGAAFLVALVTLRGGFGAIRLRPWPATALAVYLVGFSAAYVQIGAGAGALILFGAVQVTMFGGALVAREAVPPARWIGTAVALLGLGVLVGRVDLAPSEALAVLAMATAGIAWGLFSLLGRGATDPLPETAGAFVLAFPVVAAVSLAQGIGSANGFGVLLAVLSGAVTSGMGYALWYAILPRLARTAAGLAQLSVPVIAALGGAVLIGEPVTARMVMASALVIGGVLIGSLGTRPTAGSRSGG